MKMAKLPRSQRFGRRLAALGLLLLIGSCRAEGVDEIAHFADTDAALSDTVTVVNWNTEKKYGDELRHTLRSFVDRQGADLIFLQECHENLRDLEFIGGYLANSWQYPWPDGDAIGVMTLSRVRPIEIQKLPTKYREFFVTAPKVSLVTVYPLADGTTLLAVNVHLLVFERWGTLKLRSQLEDLEAVIAQHHGPVIVAGDFNTWNDKRLDLVAAMMRRLSLVEVGGFAWGRKTGDRGSAFLNWLLGVDDQLPLDRIYVRGLAPLSATVLPSEISDHRALRVEFAVLPEQTESTSR
jgi:endonuclease/exonuclease/phosphatase (EEP) superfamily protein YafD